MGEVRWHMEATIDALTPEHTTIRSGHPRDRRMLVQVLMCLNHSIPYLDVGRSDLSIPVLTGCIPLFEVNPFYVYVIST